MSIFKNQYKNIILVSVYTILAILVYTMWVHSVWALWYIDLIVGIVILAIGILIGFLYIKSEYKKNNKIANEAEEVVNNDDASASANNDIENIE